MHTDPRPATPMPLKAPSPARRIAPRLPVALTVLWVSLMLAAMPQRVRLVPNWVGFLAMTAVLVPMIGVARTNASARWVRLERRITLLYCFLVGGSALMALGFLVRAMVRETVALSGAQLLSSGVGVWLSNLLVFTLLYWLMDRGGPEARMNDAGIRPDWQFPQTAVPREAPPDWRPSFVDYLALGFTTATAFSPADVLPLTRRAKALMMLESSISLATIVIVGARAVNILGR